LGAAPERIVCREKPAAGDVVNILGGRTGRDGIGGATGSSKSHNVSSLESCGAEVQKGNAPEERKLQRLFRNPKAARMIKRCNDFGAGGVSVAVGELAEGLKSILTRSQRSMRGSTEPSLPSANHRSAWRLWLRLRRLRPLRLWLRKKI
jgi:phosphoribosylformylglycinamidine synthase